MKLRSLAPASALLAIALVLPLGAAPVAAAEPATPSDAARATAALDYVLAAQGADGSIDGSLGETADFIIGAAGAGYDPATLTGCSRGTSALDYLAAASDAAATDAAKTGKAILAVVAAGASPSSFGGRDLLARLSALYDAGKGTFGDGSTFAQAFAILAIAATGQAVPLPAVDALKALQDPDGSWSYASAPVKAGEGDSNSTAIALMALHAGGDHSLDASALAYLKTQQLPDGGFAYQSPSPYGPAASDPDSDSIVIQALIAAGEDPESEAWSVDSKNALTHLRETQQPDGGYVYPGSSENALTTVQVPAALAGVHYGAAAKFEAGTALPGTQCPGYAPSASAVVSAAASVAASVEATAPPAPSPTAAPAGDSTAGGPPAWAWPILVVAAVAVAGGAWLLVTRSRKGR